MKNIRKISNEKKVLQKILMTGLEFFKFGIPGVKTLENSILRKKPETKTISEL